MASKPKNTDSIRNSRHYSVLFSVLAILLLFSSPMISSSLASLVGPTAGQRALTQTSQLTSSAYYTPLATTYGFSPRHAAKSFGTLAPVSSAAQTSGDPTYTISGTVALDSNLCTMNGGTWDYPSSSCTLGQTVDWEVSATLTIPGGITLIIQGTVNCDGCKLYNYGTITNTGTFGNPSGTVDNYGAIDNGVGGTITNGGTLDSSGSIDNAGSLMNSGASIEISAGMTNEAGATFDNSGGSNLTIDAGVTVYNYGTITNEGSSTMLNYGTITNEGGATLDNYADIENENSAIINNEASALITNEIDATIDDYGSINNSGTLNNLGTIYNPSDSVSLNTPCINGLQVDINGGATPGQNVQYIAFNWGDGGVQNHFFPDEHVYKAAGSYTIDVTAHYKDGSAASSTASVTVGSGISSGCYSLLVSSSDGGLVHFVRDGNYTGTVQPASSETLYLAQGDDLELVGILKGVGFSFDSWTTTGSITYQSGSSSTPDIFIVVNGNSVIDANFEEPSFLASCTPSSGSTIQVGDTVTCNFAGSSVEWFSTNFSPSGLTAATSETFAAASNGEGTITATFSCMTGPYCVETFTYTIQPSTTIATCTPSYGSQVQLGGSVTCSFTGGTGITFNGWLVNQFTPFFSNSQTQTFNALSTGKGEITISWVQGGATNYESFSYQIGPNTAIASCTPDTGSTIQLFSYVTCDFTGTGTFGGWGADGLFSPGESSSLDQTFEAVGTGSGSITAFWTGTGCVVSQGPLCGDEASFTYTIAPSTGIATCTPSNNAKIQLNSTVTCSFKGGSGLTFLSWGSSLFNPPTSSSLSQTFTANVPGPGSGGITASWTDSNGAVDYETFSYNIVNPSNVPTNAYNTTLTITAHSPVNILVTDPSGREVGSDGVNNYNQIPGAFYSGMGQEPETIALPDGMLGDYTIQAFGTGSGSYVITLTTTEYNSGDVLGSQTITGTASVGRTDSYSFSVASNEGISIISSTSPTGIPEFPFGTAASMMIILMVALTLPLLLYIRKASNRFYLGDPS